MSFGDQKNSVGAFEGAESESEIRFLKGHLSDPLEVPGVTTEVSKSLNLNPFHIVPGAQKNSVGTLDRPESESEIRLRIGHCPGEILVQGGNT